MLWLKVAFKPSVLWSAPRLVLCLSAPVVLVRVDDSCHSDSLPIRVSFLQEGLNAFREISAAVTALE